VFTGAEKVARKFGYPIVYLHAARPKRGHYTITPEVLYAEPSKTNENEISEGFTQRLERDIIADPVIWLWSHRRWKNKRPTQA
jgi:KDO2-lipid IV(A) lauroyltransferase